ncbi:hypothetical protein INT43_003522 [Umbelopsis isabellina]|uniref:Uncharacterized protein n=1 Tax=Mortierella isabellina TaxID=91625 RepID=A0A8H7UGE3_MORIS|nr:hypothetical protein INT43_003522 [Umbelopsis isabellina]
MQKQQPLTPTRRNTKESNTENAESPKQPLATITNRITSRKTGIQSKTSSPVTTPKSSRLSTYTPGSPDCFIPASPLSRRTLDVQDELFKVYKDSLPSPEQPRNRRSSPSEVDDSLTTVGSDSVLDRLSRTTTDAQIIDLQQKLDLQIRENEKLRKELHEEKFQRQALEEDHKLQDEFIKALEKQLSEIKLASDNKCQSLEKELAESNELLEECRSLLLEVHQEQS